MDAAHPHGENEAGAEGAEERPHFRLPPHPPAAPAADAAAAVVVSETDANHDSSSDDDNDDALKYGDPQTNADDLYCDNMDDEDEAWVYKHMRGGIEETVYVKEGGQPRSGATGGGGERDNGDAAPGDDARAAHASSSSSTAATSDRQQDATGTDDDAQPPRQMKMLKPRSTDAVLSCPCCFTVLCMDCQKHERYANQFRAMFVMNIGVKWEQRLVYDEVRGELRPKTQTQQQQEGAGETPNQIPHDESSAEEVYYKVYCANCRTEVAALDMDDEVYHFYNCLAS